VRTAAVVALERLHSLVGTNHRVQRRLDVDGANYLTLFANPPDATILARASRPWGTTKVGDSIFLYWVFLLRLLRTGRGIALGIHVDGVGPIVGSNGGGGVA